MSSAPRHIDTMYDSIVAEPKRSCAARIASKVA
jgi:hypothetical protein